MCIHAKVQRPSRVEWVGRKSIGDQGEFDNIMQRTKHYLSLKREAGLCDNLPRL